MQTKKTGNTYKLLVEGDNLLAVLATPGRKFVPSIVSRRFFHYNIVSWSLPCDVI